MKEKSHLFGQAPNQLSTEMCFLFYLPPLKPSLKTGASSGSQCCWEKRCRKSLEELSPKPARNPQPMAHSLASRPAPATDTGISEQFSRWPHIKCIAAVKSGGTKSTDPLGLLIRIGKFLLSGSLGQPKPHLITALQTRWRPAFESGMCTDWAAHKAETENWLTASEFPSVLEEQKTIRGGCHPACSFS